MSEPITRESFTAAMEQAVAERGEDFIYPDEWRRGVGDHAKGVCQYYIEGVGGACIIGKALEILGVDISELSNVSAGYQLTERLDVNDGTLAVAASTAQKAQDDGKTWGEALSQYKQALGIS